MKVPSFREDLFCSFELPGDSSERFWCPPHPHQVSCNAGITGTPSFRSFLAGRFVLATQDTGAFIPHLSCRFFYPR